MVDKLHPGANVFIARETDHQVDQQNRRCVVVIAWSAYAAREIARQFWNGQGRTLDNSQIEIMHVRDGILPEGVLAITLGP